MAPGLHSVHFNVIDQGEDSLRAIGARPIERRRGGPRGLVTPDAPRTFEGEEAAARFYLSQLLQQDTQSPIRGLVAPESPQVVPDMRLSASQRSPLTENWTVSFVQTKGSISVFGARAVVEMDRNRELLAIDAQLADVTGISPLAALSPAEALERIAILTSVETAVLQDVQPPELTFYHSDERDRWFLAYVFKNVPAAPAGFMEGTESHGLGQSLAQRHPELHYLVDAHDGTILLYWSSGPTFDIPTECHGVDAAGTVQDFLGRVKGNAFEMADPMRNIRTYDFGLKDIDRDAPPDDPISATSAVFSNHEAAVSAHVNAMRVHDFYKSILMRDGVDDKGMDLISYVNCTLPIVEPPPQWRNATWWKHHMWYGQIKDPSGNLCSFARYLDVIAHELTHGVTEFTADLLYLRESGALNESFSDIFGIIVKNWDWSKPATGGSVSNWDWEIGSGLKAGGLPLRDMRDPTRTGDPDHMGKYVNTALDNGGVHKNSNIHNKAAYNIFVAGSQGQWIFTPREVAVLYYLCLTRLSKLATFVDALGTLVNVASTYYAGDPRRQEKMEGIRDAYAKVGIQ